MKTIRSQREWELNRPNHGNDKERREWLRSHEFEKTMPIRIVDVDEKLKPRPGTKRREIFDTCLVDGLTVEEVNKRAKEMHRGAERDGDVFIGLQAGAVKLLEAL